MSSYLSRAATPRTSPQSQAIPGREADMTPNSAGGVVFTVSALTRLRRFLVLGTEGGSYYATERKLTEQALHGVRTAIDELGVAAVDEIVAVSKGGRAAKTDPAIYALAMASGNDNVDVRRAALSALPDVCRTGTHLFHFLEFSKGFRGRGRAFKRAVSEWYTDQPVEKVAYQAVKYRQRDGWTHRDALRLAKPKPRTPERDKLFSWIAGKDDPTVGNGFCGKGEPLEVIFAYEQAQAAQVPGATAALIRQYGGLLPREALKTEHLTNPDVNLALVEAGMPMTALIRNLANLTRYGVLKPMSATTQMVCEQIVDEARIKKSRVHPLTLLSALATYASGMSVRGSSTWTPIGDIADALDLAFERSFVNVPVTGKRHMLSLDVSGSMTWGTLAGVPGITPAVGSAAMAMATARSGDPYMVFGFGTYFTPLQITKRMSLQEVVRATSNLSFGGTDCALPMVYAQREKLDIDTFVIYTDNETWAGRVQPVQALEAYRQASGIDAKLVVVGMTATDFTIADPKDPGMLDVVGFDSAAPNVIAEFSAGRV